MPAISRPGISVTPGGGGYTPFRWATSGRLTPAAATLTRISPSPGCGTGYSWGASTSGPPGDLMPIAVMVVGMDVMASLSTERIENACLMVLTGGDNRAATSP